MADSEFTVPTYLTFDRIGKELLKARIGYDWNDVYSEMIKKTKPKYRYLLNKWIKNSYLYPDFYDDFIPYMNRYYFHIWFWKSTEKYSVIYGKIYIDYNNILQYHETEEEALALAKMKKREAILERLLNSYEDEKIYYNS